MTPEEYYSVYIKIGGSIAPNMSKNYVGSSLIRDEPAIISKVVHD
ncbi:MAG: hypothetical protein ACI845_002489 [Gammaproteobacteria bacterium]|jgi:hypothetical protein